MQQREGGKREVNTKKGPYTLINRKLYVFKVMLSILVGVVVNKKVFNYSNVCKFII